MSRTPYAKCLGFKGENVQIVGVREKMFKLRGIVQLFLN